MSISDTTEAAILALIFNATPWANYADNAASTPQTNIAMALHTADPGDSGTMATSEANYTSYARGSVARTTGGFTVSGTAPCQAALVSALNFATSTGSGTTNTYFSYGKTGGGSAAILFSGAISPTIAVGAAGVTPQLTTSTVATLD